jgi:hypothetical protein
MSAKNIYFDEFSTSFNLDFEGRCLLVSEDKMISILSDFNDYQVILVDNSLLGSMQRVGVSDELSELEVQELGQKQAAFIDAMLRRVGSWNDAQAAFGS